MRTFLTWWITQLAGMFALPPAREHSDAVILEIDRDTVSLLFRSGGATTRDAQSSADDEGIRQLAQRMSMRSGLQRLLLLRLQPAQVLHKHLSLPIAARHDLKEALGFEIDRETPFARDEVYWNYTMRQADASRNCLDIDLAVVPRCVVDSIIDAGRRAGLDPSGIEVDMGTGATALIPLDGRKRVSWSRSQRTLTPLAVAACLLAVMAIAIPFIRQQWALASADAMIASLNGPAREALALRQSADRFTRLIASLDKARVRNGSALEALATATKSLPNETYLTAFSLRAGRLTMSGLSPSAAKLVGLLARTQAFREPTLDSPVVASGSEGLEAFSISVNVTPGHAL
jgi:general secretion pathway protein L